MARLSREDYEQYQRAIDLLARGVSGKFLELASGTSFEGLAEAERAELTMGLVEAAKDLYLQTRDSAAYVAAAYYADCMEAHGYEVEQDLAILDAEDIDAKSRYWAERAFNGTESAAQVVARVSQWLDGRVRGAADQTVAGSAMRDSGKLAMRTTYARVPRGGKTCGYCFILASYGFRLVTEKRVDEIGRVHPNCNCRCVPGVEGKTTVEGYEPDGMAERREMCAETIGTHDDEALKKEVETRDPQWLLTGKLPEQDYSLVSRDSYGRFKVEPDRSKRPNPADYAPSNFDFGRTNPNGEWRDLFAHDVLRWNGFGNASRTNKFKGPNGKQVQGATSPDLDFDKKIWGRGYLWEVKSPKPDAVAPQPGNELNFIGNALQKAKKNFKNPYDPETKQPVTDWDGKRRVVLNLLYRPTGVEISEVLNETRKKMRRWKIHEVLVIDPKGRLYHLK